MDIEKGLRLLAKREQKAFKADAEHLKQIEQNIFAQVKGRKKAGQAGSQPFWRARFSLP